MKTALALTLAATASAALYTDDNVTQKTLFENFKSLYGKKYSTIVEEAKRFYIFIDNLKVADARNAAELKAGGSAVHGVTKFSDLSQVEFDTGYLLSDPTMRRADRVVLSEVPVPVDAGSSKDWTGIYTTAVKDQGYCGSCWAFSATSQIESDAMRQLGSYWTLSPEQITQCDSTSYGCSGGWTEHAYDYVKKTGGLETDSDYPYTSYQGVTGTCKESSSKYVVTVSSYVTISGETNMANYMLATGPLSVCLDASSWNSYSGGIMSVCGKSVDHCVQAVGVDTSSYWLVRNSWGTGWGESGFIRLKYGSNTCAITSDPTYVVVK
jgi:hypothetical protein